MAFAGRTARRARPRSRERAHLIHVGKTGGTALKHALRPLVDAGRYELHLHPHNVKLSDVPEGEKFFFVVRDPVDRYVSGFNSRLRQGRPRHDRPWSEREREAFSGFDTPDALACALADGDERRRARAFLAMASIQHVRDSYWHWFRHRAYLERRQDDLLLIQWFPDLTPTFGRLCELLELPGDPSLPTEDVRAHRSPVGVSKDMSEGATRNAGWWYASDYAFLECCSCFDQFAGPSYVPRLPDIVPVAPPPRVGL